MRQQYVLPFLSTLLDLFVPGYRMAEHQETREDHKVQLRFLGNTNDFQERTNKELEMR